MTKEEVDNFEKVQSQLQGLHSEISILSKKSQNDALSIFKLKFVNQILEESNSVLGLDYKPFSDFEKFDEDSIPTNSDVTLILSQYLSCLEKLRADNVKKGFDKWYWVIDGETSTVQTVMPRNLKEK